MNRKTLIPILAVAFLCMACQTLFTSTVTITSVVDSAMKQWAALSVKGTTGPVIDAKVVDAHNKYRAACGVAQAALVAYKASGDQTQYVAALSAVKAAAGGIIDLIVPFITTDRGVTLKSNLTKASTL